MVDAMGPDKVGAAQGAANLGREWTGVRGYRANPGL